MKEEDEKKIVDALGSVYTASNMEAMIIKRVMTKPPINLEKVDITDADITKEENARKKQISPKGLLGLL